MFGVNSVPSRRLATLSRLRPITSELLSLGVRRSYIVKTMYSTSGTDTDILYSPPSLVRISERWTSMKNTDLQEEIKEYLDWKMMIPWKEMSHDEQIASYYLAYGSWGPRSDSATEDKSEINVTYFIFRAMFNIVMISALGVSYINWRKDKNHHDSD